MVNFASDNFPIGEVYKHIEETFILDAKYGRDVGHFFVAAPQRKLK